MKTPRAACFPGTEVTRLFSLLLIGICLPSHRATADIGADIPVVKLQATTASTIAGLENSDLWIGGAVVVTNGTKTNISTYGRRDIDDERTPSQRSHFEIGSISKSFTGILLAWLVNTDGSVKLDDSLSKFVPELSGHFAGRITLLQLANHTSGLPDSLCIAATSTMKGFCPQPRDAEDPWADTSPEDLLEFLRIVDHTGAGPFAPVYSNPGFMTLGYLISKIAHRSY